MAVKKVTELDPVSSMQDTDYMDVSHDNLDATYTSKKITFANLASSVVSSNVASTTYAELDGSNQPFTSNVSAYAFIAPIIYSNASSAADLAIVTGTAKTLVLDTPVWDDLPPSPIIAAKLGATAPTLATFITDIEQYTFDATNDYVIGATEITHKYKEGTAIYPHIHWATNGTDGTARGVKWQLKYTIQNGANNFSTQITDVVDATIPASTADRYHYITNFDDVISGTGIEIGAYICWRLERIATSHANGAPSNNPFALAIGFHVKMDTIGSRTISDK